MQFRDSMLGLLTILLLTASGCGSGDADRSPTAPVSGTVTLDGNPIAAGTIVFETKGSRQANGLIKDGKIVEVFTYEPGDGAPVGMHKVAIFMTSATPAAAIAPSPGDATPIDANYMGVSASGIPTRYNDPEKSGLTAEIKADSDNPLTFKLDSK